MYSLLAFFCCIEKCKKLTFHSLFSWKLLRLLMRSFSAYRTTALVIIQQIFQRGSPLHPENKVFEVCSFRRGRWSLRLEICSTTSHVLTCTGSVNKNRTRGVFSKERDNNLTGILCQCTPCQSECHILKNEFM